MSREGLPNAIKLLDWALKFYNNQDVEVTAQDLNILECLVDKNPDMTILAKAPILGYLKSLKP
jgi:hypothetical protein